MKRCYQENFTVTKFDAMFQLLPSILQHSTDYLGFIRCYWIRWNRSNFPAVIVIYALLRHLRYVQRGPRCPYLMLAVSEADRWSNCWQISQAIYWPNVSKLVHLLTRGQDQRLTSCAQNGCTTGEEAEMWAENKASVYREFQGINSIFIQIYGDEWNDIRK